MTVSAPLTARQRKQVYMHHADIFTPSDHPRTPSNVYSAAEQMNIYEALRPKLTVIEPRPQRREGLSAHERKMEHLYEERSSQPVPAEGFSGRVGRRREKFELGEDPLKAGKFKHPVKEFVPRFEEVSARERKLRALGERGLQRLG